jgi:hypothetical protein
MQFLTKVDGVITTIDGAERLNHQGARPGNNPAPVGIQATPLPTWSTFEIPTKDGRILLFIGAALIPAVGPAPLTMTVEESIEAARLFDHAVITPLHFEGWEHFSEGYDEIIRQYTAAGLTDRLHWARPYPGI